MATITRIDALKQFFGVPDKPVTNAELMDLRRASADEFDKLAEECAKALGHSIAAK
jgi:hypothetical protein